MLTFGGMWRWSASWRTVARVFAGVLWCRDILFGYKFIAMAKTVTPGGGPRREPGRPVLRNGFCPAALVAKPGR